MANKGKLIIISAPSGSGKSTIIGRIINDPELRLEFSVSATTRPPRKGETDGKEYYFLSEQQFRDNIAADNFAEYQEVYPGRFYGTLKSEIERIVSHGNNVVLDVDVLGGINVKKIYGEDALSIFIMAPSVDVLRERLLARGTDSIDDINKRVEKAEFETSFAPQFDKCVVNDILETAVAQARNVITDFIKQ